MLVSAALAEDTDPGGVSGVPAPDEGEDGELPEAAPEPEPPPTAEDGDEDYDDEEELTLPVGDSTLFMLAACVGDGEGRAGVMGAFRPHEKFGVTASIGEWGPSGAVRYYPMGALFLQVGYAPLDDNKLGWVFKGPTASVGAELNVGLLALGGTAGLGHIEEGVYEETIPVFDLYAGVNFGVRGEMNTDEEE